MPLLPSKSYGTALWDVHILLLLDHKSPHRSALEASYTLWLEPPQSCCAYPQSQSAESTQVANERTNSRRN